MRYLVMMPLVLACAMLSGCSPEQMVKIDTPRAIREELGAPPRVNVHEFEALRAEYEARLEERAEAKAQEAAAAARTLQRAVRTVSQDFAEQIASLQRQSQAALEAVAAEGEEERIRIEAALAQIERHTQRSKRELDTIQQRAREQAESLRQLLTLGMESVVPAVGAVPGLAWAVPLLTAVGGLLIRRPGDAAREAERIAQTRERMQQQIDALQARVKTEADAAYDQGRADALATAQGAAASRSAA